jgi:hypothetical protein
MIMVLALPLISPVIPLVWVSVLHLEMRRSNRPMAEVPLISKIPAIL